MPLLFAHPLKDIARTWGRAVLMVVAASASVDAAHAVFIDTPMSTRRSIVLRVGSANTTVNTVTFDILNANVSPSPTAVTGIPGNGAPTTAYANGVEVNVDARFTNNTGNTVQLTVDSTAGLVCATASSCASTMIPFNTISWTSYNQQPTGTVAAGRDIQNGSFAGTANQSLSNVTWSGGTNQTASTTMTNVLVFRYSNATLYPAGQYTGRVIFTATNF